MKRQSSEKKRVRNSSVKSLAVCGALAALCVVILLLGSVIETLDLTLAALCSILVWFVMLEYGQIYGALVYVVASLCALLLLPSKSPALFFAGMTGWYPFLKRWADRRPRFWRLSIKLLSANGAAFLLWYFFSALLGFDGMGWPILFVSLLAYNVAFLLFDLVLERLVWRYVDKFRKYLVRAGLFKK